MTVIVSSLIFFPIFHFFPNVLVWVYLWYLIPFLRSGKIRTSKWDVLGNSLLMDLTFSCCESIMLVVAGQ